VSRNRTAVPVCCYRYQLCCPFWHCDE